MLTLLAGTYGRAERKEASGLVIYCNERTTIVMVIEFW